MQEILETARRREFLALVLDLETNGLRPPASVLSCAAHRYRVDGARGALEPREKWDRYYYPLEGLSAEAVRVHGLTMEVIRERRGEATYPEHFRDDREMHEFIEGADCVVCHNVDFEAQFIPQLWHLPTFCTMRSNPTISGVRRADGSYKYASLAETARHYGVPVEGKVLHDAAVDAELTAAVFEAMLRRWLASRGT